jgi:hypothetical protein
MRTRIQYASSSYNQRMITPYAPSENYGRTVALQSHPTKRGAMFSVCAGNEVRDMKKMHEGN